jgi:hypothetical protein
MTDEDREEGIVLRKMLIELRGEALKQGDFEWAVNLSHVIKWMHERIMDGRVMS